MSLYDLTLRTWWRYPSVRPSSFDLIYHGFNLFEATVWAVIACLILRRYFLHRRSMLELGYALAFLTFGWTDFREAYALQTWLIGIKGVNLLALAWLRRIVIRRYYPTSRLF